jgi:hypothetical protein
MTKNLFDNPENIWDDLGCMFDRLHDWVTPVPQVGTVKDICWRCGLERVRGEKDAV